MKILTINWTYGYGSTGKLICDIEQQLKQCEFFHCYEYKTQGDAKNAYCLTNWFWSHVYNRTSKIKGLQYENGKIPTRQLIKKIEEYKPDIVHVHCPNGNTLNLYAILGYLKEHKIPTVITNHAEFFYTGNCTYAFDCDKYLNGCMACPRYKSASKSIFLNRTEEAWNKMKNAFHEFHTLEMVGVSGWQVKRMKESTICKDIPCTVITNGIDTDTFCLTKIDKQKNEHTNEHTNEHKKIFLHVTSNFSDDPSDIKGGVYLIELAKRLQSLSIDAQIWVAGKNNVRDMSEVPSNIKLLGEILDQKELAKLYNTADLAVMTSKKETFGMSCAESLCCGTPVVGFKNGGSESIAIPEFSQFVETGDVEALANVVQEWMNRKQELSISEKAINLYSKERMAQSYYQVYCDLQKRCKGKEECDGSKND